MGVLCFYCLVAVRDASLEEWFVWLTMQMTKGNKTKKQASFIVFVVTVIDRIFTEEKKTGAIDN